MVKKIIVVLLCVAQLPCVAMNSDIDNGEKQKLSEKLVELQNEHNEEIKFQGLMLLTQVQIGVRTVPLFERLVVAQERQAYATELSAATQALETCLKLEERNKTATLRYDKPSCLLLSARFKELAEKK